MHVASKDLLQSHGYYQGCSKVWLPKKSMQSSITTKPQGSHQAYNFKVNQRLGANQSLYIATQTRFPVQ